MEEKQIQKVLLDGDYVSQEDMVRAETFAREQSISLYEGLIALGVVTKDLVGQAFAEALGLRYFDLNSNKPTKEVVATLPEEIAVRQRIVFLEKNAAKSAAIATDKIPDKKILARVGKLLKVGKVDVFFSLPEDIDEILRYYRRGLEQQIEEIIKHGERVSVAVVDVIYREALFLKTSDIHFEPQEKTVIVRFRIDGVLQEAAKIGRAIYEGLLNRMKIQAQLRIDEHYAAQDGAIRYLLDDKALDLRVSVVPVVYGEKVVVRILSVYIKGLSTSDLGLASRDENILLAASKKPFGMILVVGPTGSGKTTTLYALLKNIDHSRLNITTIEDPVEYKMDGINQIQVNNRTGLTFAAGLRSIVRQDPDVILVGEIRDAETAEISVNAALTGHLLFSTFHANDAATAIPRLLDMNIEPFLLASTLEAVVAQRLARKICDTCRYSVSLSRKEISENIPGAEKYFLQANNTIYRGKGCESCNNTGYKGRTAFFEVIRMTPELQDLMIGRPSSKQIWDLARKQGARSLFEDGIEKVKNGITTFEELLRVASPYGEDAVKTKRTGRSHGKI